MKKYVLIICPNAFHLGWMGATRRIFHVAFAFRQLGFDVVLLAGKTADPKVQSKIDEVFPGMVIRSRHTGDYPHMLDKGQFTRRVWRAGWKIRGESHYWSKLSWGWADRLDLRWAGKILHEHQIKPSLIWGVCLGKLEGAVAAEHLSKILDVPWILELQDPPYRAGLGPDNDMVVGCFSRLLKDAGGLVVTANSYGEAIKERYGLSDKKLNTVPLTYEGKPVSGQTVKGESYTLSYIGTLGNGRSIKPLLEALVGIIEERPEIGESFRIWLAGSGLGFDEALAFAKANNISDQISHKGVVNPGAVHDIIQVSHALLIVQPDSASGQVPGKIFENLKTGKPIIGLMPKECEAAEILRSSGLGIIHEPDDKEGLKYSLKQLWDDWNNGESSVTPNWTLIEDFSLSRLSVKIKGVIEDCMGKNNTVV